MGRRARGVLGAMVAGAVVTAGLVGAESAAPAGAATSDPYAQAVLAASPSVYVRLGDTGSPAVDEVGSVSGVLTGGVATGSPGAIPNAADTAMTFDGVDDFVALGNGAVLQPQIFSVALWFRATPSRSGAQVHARWRTYGWGVALHPGSVQVGVYGAPGVEHVAHWKNAFDDGGWHHLVGVRSAATLTLYVDGIERASVAAPPTTRYESGGAALARDGNNAAGYFQGSLDEFALFPTALTADQVVAQYCASGVRDATCNEAPIAVAADQVQTEGRTVVLDGSASTDADGDPLTYAWELIGSDGPAVELDDPSSATPSFTALDDATYVLRLTVDDGWATSRVDATVTVENAPPVVTLAQTVTDAPASAAVQVRVTDAGPLDTTSVQLDFGDGSPPTDPGALAPAPLDISATHRYANAGTYLVRALAADDDGATTSAAIPVDVEARVPRASLFGASSARAALDLRLDEAEFEGRVHSNGGIQIAGKRARLVGGTEYATDLRVDGHQQVIDPAALRTGAEDGPWLGIEEYRPGAPGAVAAGAAYLDVSSACGRNGVWQTREALAPGLYYAACDVELSGEVATGPVTIAAEGTIELRAERGAVLTPYVDGVSLISGAASGGAVRVRARDATLEGAVVAWVGTVTVDAKGTTFACGLAGAEVVLDVKQVMFSRPRCG